MAEIEEHIAKLEAIDIESQAAPSDVLLAVEAFNADMGNAVDPGLCETATLGIPEKLKDGRNGWTSSWPRFNTRDREQAE